MTKHPVVCETCGETFYVKRHRQNKARFCSVSCTSAWRTTLKGEKNNNWKGGKSTLVCLNCGHEFLKYESCRVGKNTFCTTQCYFQYQPNFKRKGFWTEQEEGFLRQHYSDPNWTPQRFASALGRSIHSIRARVSTLKLTYPYWSNELKLKHSLYLHYRNHSAGSRNIFFEIPWGFFKKIIDQPCHYCGRLHVGSFSRHDWGILRYNGLDRIDSDKGYTVDNVYPCCGQCNRAKMAFGYDEFLDWVKRVNNNLRLTA